MNVLSQVYGHIHKYGEPTVITVRQLIVIGEVVPVEFARKVLKL